MTYKEFKYLCFPSVDCRRGSPMGRKSFRTKGVEPTKIYDRTIPINQDGADPGGAYWGSKGLPLRCAFDAEGTYRMYYRGAHKGDVRQAGHVYTV